MIRGAWRVLRGGSLVVAFTCLMSLTSCAANQPKNAAPIDSSPAPCIALCDDEARCGDVAPTCRSTCARESGIFQASVTERVVACRKDSLATNCYGKSSAFTHGDLLADGRCFGIAAAAVGKGEDNRRRFADASCMRMLRCQVSGPPPGPEVRKECVELTIHPPDGGEADEREAMMVLDALRPEVVTTLGGCLHDAPCPAPGKSDSAGDACLLAAIGRSDP